MSNESQEINKEAELARIQKFADDAYAYAATEFVKHLGTTLLGWKGIEVNVVINRNLNDLVTIQGGPVVQAVLKIGPEDKDFKKVLYDVAKTAKILWNPVEVPTNHKVIKHKGDKIINKKGEPEFIIPLKYCKVSTYKRVSVKGPDGISVSVEDETGHKLESDMLFEARVKLSQLIQWDNKEEE